MNPLLILDVVGLTSSLIHPQHTPIFIGFPKKVIVLRLKAHFHSSPVPHRVRSSRVNSLRNMGLLRMVGIFGIWLKFFSGDNPIP
jgi:hypothetical protein